jgi:hypothetical protein
MRRISTLFLLGALVVGCGPDEDPEEARTEARGSGEAAAAPWCDDLEPLGDVAEGNLVGMENGDDHVQGVIQAYTDAHRDTYAGRWLDREHGGTLVLAFTDDPEAHLEAILALPLDGPAISPTSGAGAEVSTNDPEASTVGDSDTVVDVVPARYTEAELSEIQDDAITALESTGLEVWGVGQDTEHNRVSIDVEDPDDEARRIVAEHLPVEAVCVSGSASDPPAPPPVDPEAPPTLLPAEGTDALVTCGGMSFPYSALENPLGFEDTDHPLAAALLESLSSGEGAFLGEGSWRLLLDDGDHALVAQGDPPGATMSFEWTGDRWIWSGLSGGPCETRVVLPPGLGEADWILDPAFPEPGPDTTEIHVLVTERSCTGAAEIGDRLVGPEIRQTAHEVVVAFAVIPLEGGAFTCPGNPSLPVTVELDEPLGDRVLADGGFFPPHPAGEPHPDR